MIASVISQVKSFAPKINFTGDGGIQTPKKEQLIETLYHFPFPFSPCFGYILHWFRTSRCSLRIADLGKTDWSRDWSGLAQRATILNIASNCQHIACKEVTWYEDYNIRENKWKDTVIKTKNIPVYRNALPKSSIESRTRKSSYPYETPTGINNSQSQLCE